jgi:hypothetical protein
MGLPRVTATRFGLGVVFFLPAETARRTLDPGGVRARHFNGKITQPHMSQGKVANPAAGS